MIVTLTEWLFVQFFSTCLLNSLHVLNSIHVFVHPLVFPSTFVVEFCFFDNVRLIRQVITKHVNWSELIPLRLSADQNFDLCRSASHLNEGFWYDFKRITHFRESNSNSIKNMVFRVIIISYSEKFEYIYFYSKQKSNYFYKSWSTKCIILTVWELHIVTAIQCDSYKLWQL
jgi:hypothetical protein